MKLHFLLELSHLLNFMLVRRSEWQARRSKGRKLLLYTPVPYVVIHHSSNTAACYTKKECSTAMREMQEKHMDQMGMTDIGYHFAVGSDGAAYEGRGWDIKGTHAQYFDPVSIGICLIGNWTIETPPEVQLKTTKALIVAGVELGFIQRDYKLIGHRQIRTMECPGDALYEKIQSWDQYRPVPDSYRDLVNMLELPASVKWDIIANHFNDSTDHV